MLWTNSNIAPNLAVLEAHIAIVDKGSAARRRVDPGEHVSARY